MIKNNLIIAWRRLLRSKLPTAINIIGLAIGIAGCLLVFQITSYELGVNKSISERDRIYRVWTQFNGEFSMENSGVPTGVAALAAEAIQGTEVQCMFHSYNAKVEVPEPNGKGRRNLGVQEDLVITDPSFFDLIQNFEWLEGSAYQSLAQPNQVVLTEQKVKQYFGLANPRDAIGRELIYADSLVLTVSGVLRERDFSSDFTFTDFISAASIPGSLLKQYVSLDDWDGVRSADQFFVKAAEGISAGQLAEQLQPLNDRYNADIEAGEARDEFKLQPLSELHFNQSLRTFDNGPAPAHLPTLYGLMVIAGMLLLIAAVNFINLATVQATRRSKETGVRKVIGASRQALAKQYLTETALLAVLALPVALGLTELAGTYFTDFLPEGLEISVSSPKVLAFLVLSVVLITFISGLYPAFMMASFNPAFAIKNQSIGKGSAGLRKGLISFQFVLAQAFIIGAIIIGQQLHFALNKDLGFNKEAIIYFYLPWQSEVSKRQLFTEELRQQPGVLAATMQNKPPIEGGYQTGVLDFERNGEITSAEVHFRFVDTAYLHVFDIQLIAGRNLLPSDTIQEIVINQKMVNVMGFSSSAEAIGKTVKMHDKNIPIAGVVADFHLQSLHNAIPPLAITTSPGWSVAAKLTSSQPLSSSMGKCKATYATIFPGVEFNPMFMDESIAQLYESELRMAKLINTATGLAILLSCLGLFGLAFYTVNARAKEISIRKVLGASVASVVGLLSKEVLLLVAGSLLLAGPLAYYFVERWLQDFAYRVDIQWWVFALAGVLAIGVAFLTVSFQSVKAALANPVESLKSE
ncbi:MAG TPA: ABC transporter permease [Saprospiraceae bacterium]|nr:ABC transporter permease [Saprospiraceae bacterium]HMQ83160.1 ABC transporter permease [Saprospiraceae bacterium]